MRTLCHSSDLAWCMIEDFNDIYSNEEKRGSIPHPLHLIRGFCEVLNDCHLHAWLPLHLGERTRN